MKPIELKTEYVRLRAEGNSYSLICEQLHISKSTCTKWEKDLSSEIDDLKRAALLELCESYCITKEARIRKLGDTLDQINAALDQVDFSTIDPVRLLDFKLKYTEALKSEYLGIKPSLPLDGIDAKTIMTALADLLSRVQAGEVTTEQAQKESGILAQIVKAYESLEVKTKLDRLETIISGRGE